jgi:Spy/CpxP family protein refolding chaperone
MISLFAIGAAFAQDSDSTEREHARERGEGMSQRGQRGSMGPERNIRMMTRRLELDDTQVEQVKGIYAAVGPELESLREQGRSIRMAMRDLTEDDADYEAKKASLAAERDELEVTAKGLRENIRTEIDTILTPEQREEFAAAMERGRERGPRNRRRDGAKPEA